MNRFILTSIIMGLFALAWPDISVAAKPKPGSGKQSASQQRPDTSRRVIRENYANKKQSKSHQKVEKAKLEMTHRHTDVKNMELQVSHAKSLEAKAKRDYERASGDRRRELRSEYNRLRANTANHRDQLSAAKAEYRAARAVYKQANRELQGERSSRWSQFIQGIKSMFTRKARPRGKKVNFANHHMGPTGSGNPQPNVEPRGILNDNSRVSVVLERQPMPLN
jgi:hypothetical protein